MCHVLNVRAAVMEALEPHALLQRHALAAAGAVPVWLVALPACVSGRRHWPCSSEKISANCVRSCVDVSSTNRP